jgi:predicted phage terminase large subunit-like protein
MKNSKSSKGLELSKIKAERCKRSFYYFFCEFWETIEAVDLIPNWHIKFICDELQKVYDTWETGSGQNDIIINVPPGSSKSTICTQLYPVWLWIKNPTIRIISSSYASDLSTAHAVRSRNCIASDKFKLYFSDLVAIKNGEDNKTWYKNTKKGERYATSTGGAVTGMHADFIIVDDPVNPKQAESEVQREVANKHIKETLSTRKTDKNRSVTILIMQRLHESDPTGIALKEKKDKVNHICLPGEVSDKVKPEHVKDNYENGLLDNRRLNREALDKLKTDLGSYGYAGQIAQIPSPEGGGQLKKAWFGRISFEEFMKIKGKVNIFLDTAYTSNQKNDPTALMATSYVNNNLYVMDSTQVWKELPELLKYIPSYAEKNLYNNASKILIEPKASGKSTAQSLKNTKYNTIELPPPLDDKVTRVSNIAAFVEAGRCILVEGNWIDGFLGECASFPNGTHDDQVDNLTNAITYYDSNSGRIRTTV